MDPYLEDPELWPDVHHTLISEIRSLLNPLICTKYVARVDVRVYTIDDADPARDLFRIRDVKIESASTLVGPRVRRQAKLSEVDESLEIMTMADDDSVEEAFIRIVDAKSKNPVTHIEADQPS